MPSRFVVDFASKEDFFFVLDSEIANGGMLVRGAQPVPGDKAGIVDFQVAGSIVASVQGVITGAMRSGVAVGFDGVPSALTEAAARLRGGPEKPAPDHRHATEKLADLTVAQKIQAAMSGDREMRLALLRDHNKVLHGYVLR